MRLVSPIEAAYVLGTSRQTVWKWLMAGKLPSIQFGVKGKRMVDIGTFLMSHKIDPKPFFETLDQMALQDSGEDEE